MQTNNLMLRELLDVYHPKERGILLNEENELIKKTLHIDEMDILALRNLRDYVVMRLSVSDNIEDWDRMSAITCCIDCAISDLGGEV